MVERIRTVPRPRLDVEHELPDAPHFRPLPPQREPPALIAGHDLEHYWNQTKWPALVTVVVQTILFLANRPASLEWFLDIVLAVYLAIRLRRGDRQYLLAVTGIAGAFAGFGLALAHVVLAHRLFTLFELISRPAITAIVTMVAGTGPLLLWDRWQARRHRTLPPPPPQNPEPQP